MEKQDLIIYESPAVIKHLEILQGIITRMANNSASCKTWTITIVSALLVLSVGQDKVAYPLWITLIPTVLFYLLDSFYLGLERSFIKMQRDFVKKLASNSLKIEKVYKIEPKRNLFIHLGFIVKGMVSFSTSFIYIPLILLLLYLSVKGG